MLERISWVQARQLFHSSTVALVPVGSTEQHGPHLPLGTDFLTAQALALAVARELKILCTPVIPLASPNITDNSGGRCGSLPKRFGAS
jgi:creatinine amidohydrolase